MTRRTRSSPIRWGASLAVLGSSVVGAVLMPTTNADASSGPLAVNLQVPLPIPETEVVTAEAPDGAVFVAPSALGTGPGPPVVVWVVDGAQPAAVAEHTAGSVVALAANTSTLFVAGTDNVISYSRHTGNQARTWSVPSLNPNNATGSPVTTMVATAHLVLISQAQGNAVRVYGFNPGSRKAPRLLVRGLNAALGPDGSVAYERADHHLVIRRLSGATKVGPVLAALSNGEGGGVQYVGSVAGNIIWVLDPAGQGLDASLTGFSETTLARLGTAGGTANETMAGTTLGTLALDGPAPCSQSVGSVEASTCVTRLSPNGQATDPLNVGTSFSVLGPDPVVIAANPANQSLVVDRIT